MPTVKLSERCGRCPRVDDVEVTIDEAVARVKAQGPREKALTVVIDGKQVLSYDYLCEECRGICSAYAEGMRTQDKRSARRFKRVRAEHPDRPASPTSRPPGRLRTASES
jgi:hypothetical protein